MTDVSQLVNNSTSVSSDMMYSLKPNGARGRAYRCNFQPTNKATFSGGDTIVSYLAAGRRNTFLDTTMSYIKYTIVNGDATSIQIDNNAACVIQRLDIYHGSNVLEQITGYNVLYNYLMDFQLDISSKYGLATSYGFKNLGDENERAGAVIPATSNFCACMPLLSGVIGTGIDKYLPLHSLADDLRVEITLESHAAAFVQAVATTTNYTITNVEFVCQYIELSDEAMQIVNSQTNLNDTLYISGNSWKHYTSTLPAMSGNYASLVPARFASVKQLVCLPRGNTQISSTTSYSLSSRINPNFDSYFWRVGGVQIPQKAVVLKNSVPGGYGEAYMEIQRSMHCSNSTNYSGSIGFDYFNVSESAVAAGNTVATNTGANSYKNGFAIACDMELYSNRPLISGYNSLNSQVFFEAMISTAITSTYNLDFYANYDHIIIKDQNGILSVRF